MPGILLAIISNTFHETIRQPIYGVVLAATLLVLIFCPSLAMFSMDDDNQLLIDIGLSTLLLSGLLLGAFSSTSVLTEEIENKTALTVLSKTVRRAVFILGKFIGLFAAVILAIYLLVLALLMVVRHGVLQTASDKSDLVVITFGATAGCLALIIALVGNYFYRWRFSSTAILCGAFLGSLALALLVFIDPQWHFNPANNHIAWQLWRPIALTVFAVIILNAVAIMSATRFNMIMTLTICLLVCALGVMFEQWLGPIARARAGLSSNLAWIPLTLLPCLNFYVATNAVYRQAMVPLNYIALAAGYAFLYVSACLLFAICLFRSREIG